MWSWHALKCHIPRTAVWTVRLIPFQLHLPKTTRTEMHVCVQRSREAPRSWFGCVSNSHQDESCLNRFLSSLFARWFTCACKWCWLRAIWLFNCRTAATLTADCHCRLSQYITHGPLNASLKRYAESHETWRRRRNLGDVLLICALSLKKVIVIIVNVGKCDAKTQVL